MNVHLDKVKFSDYSQFPSNEINLITFVTYHVDFVTFIS